MKIAILSCFYPYRGGIAQFNANLFTELSKDNDVCAFNFTRQYPKFLFPGKTQKVSPQDEAQIVESTAVLDTANPFNWYRAAKAIRSWSPDILIMRYWMPYFAPSLGTVARLMGKDCKCIAILDNVIPHEKRFFDRIFTKWFLKGIDGCITLCGEVAKDLLSITPSARYSVIPHPVYTHFGPKVARNEATAYLTTISSNKYGIATDTPCPRNDERPRNDNAVIANECEAISDNTRLPRYARNDNRVILFFGLIREYKGLDILLEAFKLLDPRYQLIIAGEPYGSFDKYQKIIDSDPLAAQRISLFLDYISDSEVKYFFSAADVVVLPYRSATQSGISSISNFFEIPMIVTDVGGLKESIGNKGLIAFDISPKSIATEIQRFFDTPHLKENCEKALRQENQSLSWNNFSKSLMSFIDTL